MSPEHDAPGRAPAATPVMPGSRFTRLLFAVAITLGAIAIGARLVRGLRTGHVEWLEMSLPAAAMLGMSAVMVGPRRPALYYPLLVAGFALLVAFYALPHRVRPGAAPRRPPAQRSALAAPAPRPLAAR